MALDVSSVVEKLRSLLIQEAIFLGGVQDQVEWATGELKRLQCFLQDAEIKWIKGDLSLKDWLCEVRDTAYDLEDNINTFKSLTERQRWWADFLGPVNPVISRYAHTPADLITLHKVGVEINRLKIKIKEIYEIESRKYFGIAGLIEKNSDVVVNDDDDSSFHTPRFVSHHLIDDEDVIGIEKDKKQLVKQLLDPENRGRHIIAIFGMPGVGKTTLARRVYSDTDVKRHFSILCWVVVSRSYRISELLKNILQEITGIGKDDARNMRYKEKEIRKVLEKDGNSTDLTLEDLDRMTEQELKERLAKSLEEKRYLVVLDDICTIDVWEKLNQVFPDCSNGSRIMFTTSNMDVAKSADPWMVPHEMQFLNDEQSWEVLRHKVFPTRKDKTVSVPAELEGVGRMLASKCGGLPLALLVLGAFLAKKDPTPTAWLETVANIDWESMKAGQELFDLFALSYKDLPSDHLKSCFLYTASFPEGSAISVSKLIRLWISEGFIPQRPKQTMEETARGCLEELIQRSMVQVAERSLIHGQVKKICIHVLLRDWCISKARKIGFLKVCSSHLDLCTLPDAIPSRRVALDKYNIDDDLSASIPKLRTLLVFSLSLERSFHGLIALRVVDLEGARGVTRLPDQIDSMIHLKYLGLRNTGIRSVPSSVGYICNLQTFDVRGTLVEQLPSTLWKNRTLRNLFTSRFESSRPESIESFKNIHTLDFINAGIWLEKVSVAVSSAPNMRKLRIDAIMPVHWKALARLLDRLGRLKFLSLGVFDKMPMEILAMFSNHVHLHELRLRGLSRVPQQLLQSSEFPPNLTKLVLDCFTLQQDPMPTLEKLPNLVVLRLGPSSYEGKAMTCSAGGFPLLQCLVLYLLEELEEWLIDVQAMPSLMHLSMGGLKCLKNIPAGLQHVTSLQELRLAGMPKEFMAAVDDSQGADLHNISVTVCSNFYLADLFD